MFPDNPQMGNDGCPDPTQPATADAEGRYYGKYRGEVVDNIDLEARGRVLAYVPAVPGAVLNWALPCVPYAGEEVGSYMIPPIGANIWIEFEGGNPNFPIWSGGWWEIGEFLWAEALDPVDAPLVKIIRTDFNTFVLNDTPTEGGVILETSAPAVDVATPITMTFSTLGVEINCGICQMLMNPEEGITILAAETLIEMTPEGITMEGPVIDATAEGDVAIEAGGACEVAAGGDVSISAVGACEMTAGGDVSVAAAGAAEVTGGGDVAVTGGGAVEVTAGGDVAVSAAGACEMSALGDVAISALGACEVSALGDIAISALGACEVTALVNVDITGILQTMNGLVEVDGDLLIDGQQPLLI